ncbi:MAG: hypothetical protein H6600_08920 [Flavobacteriales bacterium]|nr:hypothetical protein [Flavobacteriales bacterium]MCB9198569.1 hypothetical protein [Flavobacteriales bacterium]
MIKFLILSFITLCSLTGSAQFIDPRTKIPIYFEVNDDTFPESWHSDEIAAKGVDLDTSEIERSKRNVLAALKKYPIEFLQKNLKGIYVLKSIEFFGQKFGGTNSSDIVYIANNGVSMGYTNFYLEKSFHHEFSSILLRNYPSLLDKSKWAEKNGISYGAGGVQALKNNTDSQSLQDKWASKGFLHEYACSSQENDFNAFAENIFNPDKDFYNQVEKFEVLKHKFDMIIDFYAHLDPWFSRNFFEMIREDYQER